METTEYRLGDVCKLRNGYAFKSENFTNEGVPVIRISNIKDNEATPEKALKTNPSSVFDKFAVKKGDILIAMSGATTGKFGIYNSEEKAYQNQRVGCFVITDEEKLTSDYLYLLLNGLKRKIESDAYGGGQPNISSTIIENYKINLPSIINQEKIALVLSKARLLIKQRAEGIRVIDNFIADYFLKQFKKQFEDENKLISISELIDKGIIKEIQDGNHGEKHPKSIDFIEDGIPFIMANCFVDNKLFIDKAHRLSKYWLKNLRIGFSKQDDILLTHKGTIGQSAINDSGFETIILSPQVTYYRIDQERINKYFLKYLFLSPYFQRQLKKESKQATRDYIGITRQKKLKIILPDLQLQNQFAIVVEKIEIIKLEFKRSLTELENLLGSLTQRAFSGDLNIVENIEILGSIKIQPKNTAQVIAVDNMNKQLADFHNSIADSGAPIEIDNKLKQLDAELKLRGEIPFWDEYVKYRLIKGKQTTPFTFEKLWKEITTFPFESVPDYDKVKEMIFNLLKTDKPFLKQRFNESDKQIELQLNETSSA